MDSETLLLVVITVLSFAVVVFAIAVFAVRKTGRSRKDAVIFSIDLNDKEEEKAADFLKKINFPLAFDIVVQQLGTERENYFVASRRDAGKAESAIRKYWPNATISASDDYIIFNHSGAYDAFRVSIPEHEFGGHDISAVDLSKINEIGEGALIRFFRDPYDKSTDIKVLGLFSAPSERQMIEVESVVKSSFRGRKIYVPKDKDKIFSAFSSAEEIAR